METARRLSRPVIGTSSLLCPNKECLSVFCRPALRSHAVSHRTAFWTSQRGQPAAGWSRSRRASPLSGSQNGVNRRARGQRQQRCWRRQQPTKKNARVSQRGGGAKASLLQLEPKNGPKCKIVQSLPRHARGPPVLFQTYTRLRQQEFDGGFGGINF